MSFTLGLLRDSLLTLDMLLGVSFKPGSATGDLEDVCLNFEDCAGVEIGAAFSLQLDPCIPFCFSLRMGAMVPSFRRRPVGVDFYGLISLSGRFKERLGTHLCFFFLTSGTLLVRGLSGSHLEVCGAREFF